MRKLSIVFMLVAVLLVVTASPALADGHKQGFGGDPSWEPHPPNDVWVPQSAFEARGAVPPGKADWNNGAIFHVQGPGG